jgi:hypothetical protein
MCSELKLRHCPLKNYLARIERQYAKVFSEQAKRASQVKSRNGIPFIPGGPNRLRSPSGSEASSLAKKFWARG